MSHFRETLVIAVEAFSPLLLRVHWPLAVAQHQADENYWGARVSTVCEHYSSVGAVFLAGPVLHKRQRSERTVAVR